MKYQAEIPQPKKRHVFRNTLIILGIILFFLVLFLYLAMGIIIKGPSKSARDLFVVTCMETSFAKLFPPIYLSDEEIDNIMKANSVIDSDEVTDTNMIIDDSKPKEDQKDIEVIDVVGATYKGKLMIVKDPSRVVLIAPDEYGEDKEGEKLDKMMKKVNAVAAINGGGFVDENGVGNGGIPLGVVVRNGKFLYGENRTGTVNVVGFDENNILHVGNMTVAQMKERKIRDAVSFGPALIVNSNPMKTTGSSGGLNPRTAIGQRKDGSVLLLVIDGRQPHSLGANFKDLIDVMQKYGAVNAGNLDGGSSSMLYYNNELITTCASLYGPRKIPNGFAVLPKE